MTAPATPSWINKRQPQTDWPDWLGTHLVGKPDPNGSFLIMTELGQARVHVGNIVFEWKGWAHTCRPSEAKSLIAELHQADMPPPADQRGPGRRSEAEVADRRDDTDDITARIRATNGDVEPLPPPKSVPVRPVPGRPIAQNPVTTPIKTLPANGTMPSIEWIQLDRLNVDDTYQRSVETAPSRALISRIGREWDWRLCVPLMVSRRDDGLYVIDGQHRLFGARLRTDVPQLPCSISTYDGPADEAAMFVAANRERRTMNRLDDFHAAQAGGNEEALAVAAIITSVGFTVSRTTGSATWVPGQVAFTSAIAKVRRRHGDELPRRVLAMMAEVFKGQRLVAGSSIFTAACRLLIASPDGFDPDLLPKAMAVFDMPGGASFLQGSRGGDERTVRLREMLIEAASDVQRGGAA